MTREQKHIEALFDIADRLEMPTGSTPGQIAKAAISAIEKSEHAPTGIESLVCADIAARQRLGIAKYGCTVEANKGGLKYWMQNLFEEILDASIYLKRAIIELENAEHHSNGKLDEVGQMDGSDSASGDLPNPKD